MSFKSSLNRVVLLHPNQVALTFISCVRRTLLAAFFLAFYSTQWVQAQNLSIYCEDDAPLQFVGADGKLTGFSIEVVQEIQRRLGNKDRLQMVPWARGVASLNLGANNLLFSMARTAERDPQYQWIGPMMETTYGFYVPANSKLKITSIEDAKHAGLIGVYRDDMRDQYLTKLGFTNLDRANSNRSSFVKLMLGRNAMYVDSPLGVKGLAESVGYTLADVKLSYNFLRVQLYIAASKGTDPAIIAKWNSALESMKKDGYFFKIHKKYFPHIDPPGPAITKF